MPGAPILFCSHVVEMGGAEIVLADLLAALDRTRFAPHLACPADGPLASRCRGLGVPVHRVPFGSGGAWRKAASLPRAARALRAVARENGCRLLIATSMISGYAGVLAQRADLGCVWHVHVAVRSRIAAWALRRARGVIAPSRAGLAAIAPGLERAAHATVIPNGVAERFFTAAPAGWRDRLGVTADSPLLGIVGRLDPQKGHDVLLDAFARTVSQHTGHLVVAGGELFAANQARLAGYGERLRARAAAPDLRGRVHLLGPIDDPAGLFAELDLVVVPSTAPESAPRAIAEAQAAGRAVIASRIGGTAEMIDDGATGVLVEPGDAAALAHGIARCVADGALRRRLGERARAHAAAHYRLATFAQRCEDAFTRALAARA